MAINSTRPEACPQEREMGEAQVDRELEAQVLQRYLDVERRKWLTIEEAASVLRISKDVVFRLVHTNKLPLLKEGRVMRIHLEDLNACRRTMEEWMEL